jgi:hypothetical protein
MIAIFPPMINPACGIIIFRFSQAIRIRGIKDLMKAHILPKAKIDIKRPLFS